VTAFQLYVRRSRSAGETSTAFQPFALAETLFYLVIGDHDGASSRTLMLLAPPRPPLTGTVHSEYSEAAAQDSKSWPTPIVLADGPSSKYQR